MDAIFLKFYFPPHDGSTCDPSQYKMLDKPYDIDFLVLVTKQSKGALF